MKSVNSTQYNLPYTICISSRNPLPKNFRSITCTCLWFIFHYHVSQPSTSFKLAIDTLVRCTINASFTTSSCREVRFRDEHGFGFGLFRTGCRLFCRIWIGLGFEILPSTGFGFEFGFTDFFDNFANMLENVEMTHEPNSSFECYTVIIHFFRL